MWADVAVGATRLSTARTVGEEAVHQSASCPDASARRPGIVIEWTAANGCCCTRAGLGLYLPLAAAGTARGSVAQQSLYRRGPRASCASCTACGSTGNRLLC
jgi:hypothetical protein